MVHSLTHSRTHFYHIVLPHTEHFGQVEDYDRVLDKYK